MNILKRVFYLILFTCFVIGFEFAIERGKEGKEVEEGPRIKEITKEKLKQAEEAKKRAAEAQQKEKEAKSEIEKYKKLEEHPLNTLDRKNVELKIGEWEKEAKYQSQIKDEEQKKEEKLRDEAKKLIDQQKQIEQEFISTEQSGSKIKEEFEQCIKKNIINFFNEENLKKAESKQLQTYLDQLSQKLGELTLYERINFYKSEKTTEEEWEEIHKKALENPHLYEESYITVLQEIKNLKNLIAELLKEENIVLPTTKQNDACLVHFYPALDRRIQELEKLSRDDDSGSWDN
jgi:hypothetical protein